MQQAMTAFKRLFGDAPAPLLEHLAGTGQKQAQKMESDLGDVFKKTLSGMNVARRDELVEIQRQLEGIEVRLSVLESREKATD